MDGLIIALSIMVVIDILLTIIIFILKKKRRCLGTLVINMTDPEKDIYRVVMDDLQDLEKEKVVYLKVQIEDDAQK